MIDRTTHKAILASGTTLAAMFALAAPAFAQSLPADAPEAEDRSEAIIVTGSRIKRDPNDSSLPLQIITTQDLGRNSISNPEQLVAFLTTNGSAGDNLASNGDVVGGTQRGNNGASFANLRGQGAGGTLVLLNGRRVAAHGLNGAGVDLNQLPFAVLDRVEVLKDGASAIYGTDAIGGVINFITKKDFTGLGLSGFTDITQEGDSPIYRLSATAGYGKLDEQGFNIVGSISYAYNGRLDGKDRDFVNTFQPNRGISVDTRGTPFATIVPLANTAIASTGTAPFIPGTTTRATAINPLNLVGQPGCAVNPDQARYESTLWGNPSFFYSCTYDTGRAATLQQQLSTLTWFGRGTLKLGGHQLAFEVTGSDADSAKRFSELQLTPNTTTQNYAFPRTANPATYDRIRSALLATFPTDTTLATRLGQSLPLSYRWRCLECGRREIFTNTQTQRYALSLEGPIFEGWDYRAGASIATSKARSTLGGGYYFRGTLSNGAPDPSAPTAPGATAPGLIGALNSGVINPFLFPGQLQSAAALAQFDAVSARGVVLYGGKYTTTQADASVSGKLLDLPGGAIQIAAGIDYREEKYSFNGDQRAAAARPVIIAAPFDDGNALTGVRREIKAAYGEILLPIFTGFEVTAAGRIDEYSQFGSTFNPKIDFKFRPIKELLFRGSYNTGFRVPSFNQQFNGQSVAVYTGADLADPRDCPNGVVNAANPRCGPLAVNIIQGGKPTLDPETAKSFSAGVVFQPSRHFVASLDWWYIKRENSIQVPDLTVLRQNYNLFEANFIRDASGNLIAVDQTYINSGGLKTQGLELSVRFDHEFGRLIFSTGIDGTYLLQKRLQVLAGQPFGPSLIGVYSVTDDLGLRWKHNAFVSLSDQKWSVTLTQIFRDGYTDQVLPGIVTGAYVAPDFRPRVKPYIIYNLSTQLAVSDSLRFTMGVKNLFNTDPPFAVAYDSNNGSGSSWEPRVADPRGRSFTLNVEVKF